jgi:hypothetical protein
MSSDDVETEVVQTAHETQVGTSNTTRCWYGKQE